MKKTLSVGFLAVLSACLSSAWAGPVTFAFSGHVSQVPLDEIYGDINPSDSMQGKLSFDTSAADLIPGDSSTGSYDFSAPFGMTLTIGAHNFTTSGLLNIGIVNSFVDQFTVFTTSATGDLTLELFLQDNSGLAFNSDQLPLALPPLSDFSQRDFHIDAVSDLGEAQIDGQLDSQQSATVPEPAVFTLALTGASVLLASSVRKRLFK